MPQPLKTPSERRSPRRRLFPNSFVPPQINIQFVDEEKVNHPKHYGGDTTYEAIKVIEAWELGFCLGNTAKYICRAGKKASAAELDDLKKAAWYLNRRIEQIEKAIAKRDAVDKAFAK